MYFPLKILNVPDNIEIFEEGSPFKPFQFKPFQFKLMKNGIYDLNIITPFVKKLQIRRVTIQDIPSVCGLRLVDHFDMFGCWSLALAVENGKEPNCSSCEFKTKTRKPRKKQLFPKKLRAKAEKAMMELRLALKIDLKA